MKSKAGHEHWQMIATRWLKFCMVGAIGIGVQLATLTALIRGLHLHYLIATPLAVEAAILHNFIWHERWTWRDRTRRNPDRILIRLAQFNLSTGMVSMLGNAVFMWLLVGHARLHYVDANLLTIASCSLINFTVSHWFVFRFGIHGRPHCGSYR